MLHCKLLRFYLICTKTQLIEQKTLFPHVHFKLFFYVVSFHYFVKIMLRKNNLTCFCTIKYVETRNLSFLPFSFSIYSPNKSHLFFLPFFFLPLPKFFKKFNLHHFVILPNFIFSLGFLKKSPIFFLFNITKLPWHVQLCHYISQHHHYFLFQIIDFRF